MLIGYAQLSKTEGSQTLYLQRDVLAITGVGADQNHSDQAMGKKGQRHPGH